jgi:RIO kinase 1
MASKDKYQTFENVFDDFTYRNLHKLISQGHFEGLVGTLAMGKEANVFIARRRDGSLVAVKIYRLESCDFTRMYSYIKPDPRYCTLKSQRRKVIFAWAQREYRNLLKAREVGVRVPMPITCLFNILVLEFIGDKEPANKLKNHYPKNKKKFFDQVVGNMAKLHKAGFVHADLSEFNILNYKDDPVFIDFSQCTPLENPNSEEYLERDVRNVAKFFRKIGVKTDEESLRANVVGKP